MPIPVLAILAIMALLASVAALADWPNPPGRALWNAVATFLIILVFLLMLGGKAIGG